MRHAIWIYRDADGIVMAASVAEYTEPETLRQWRAEGMQPELVIAESVTLGRPLPADAQVFISGAILRCPRTGELPMPKGRIA